MKQCKHDSLELGVSPHGLVAGFKRSSQETLDAALQTSSSLTNKPAVYALRQSLLNPSLESFPAPLVLPDDALDIDKKYDLDAVHEWEVAGYRNKVTPKRNVIYVAAPPEIDESLEDMVGRWSDPIVGPASGSSTGRSPAAAATGNEIATPDVEDILEYLRAFYHPLPVRRYPHPLRFVPWTGNDPSQKGSSKRKRNVASSHTPNANHLSVPSAIGLQTPKQLIRIRTRPTPPQVSSYPAQINLTDLICDGATAILPADAYAIVMLVHQDLYEDEDDDFACGRAYGGSRICTVSTARYHPGLDGLNGVDGKHAWPASHCVGFVRDACGLDPKDWAVLKKAQGTGGTVSSAHKQADVSNAVRRPIHEAVEAFTACTNPSLATTWLERVCRTVSHELGHCFGIDHCQEYACMMQSTSSIADDVRQPPYLCPIDLMKVVLATGCEPVVRYERLRDFCGERRDGAMFAAFAAWLEVRLGMMGVEVNNDTNVEGGQKVDVAGNHESNPIMID